MYLAIAFALCEYETPVRPSRSYTPEAVILDLLKRCHSGVLALVSLVLPNASVPESKMDGRMVSGRCSRSCGLLSVVFGASDMLLFLALLFD